MSIEGINLSLSRGQFVSLRHMRLEQHFQFSDSKEMRKQTPGIFREPTVNEG
jgi:hypothetical protein